ncbi:MAG: hypothetical protein R2765_00070 [Ferruginibacter sp.]|nr:hypothetical protein [Bacteroidota bacterium]MBX2919018.1 hypothetical protein [Ferruginibacter sp.]MCB0709284.1 hypothetical protein [Chitinophagaceae bacterium]
MKIFFGFILCASLFWSCSNNGPDVSNIKVQLKTMRFEKGLFNLDTANFSQNLDKLIAAYPTFGENFLSTILNADPHWSADSTASYVHGFIMAYKPVYDSAAVVFKDFSKYEDEIIQAVKYVKYYFPNFKDRSKIITYIGPLDGYGDILSDDAFIIGLHHHLGKNFSLYKSALVQETYPDYISNRFTPGYIVVNCMKNVMNDLYPEKMDDKPLVQQMVEKGKRLYVLSKLLPKTEEYMLIGYTKEQLKAVYEHEQAVWALFVQNNFLQTIDANIIKNYIGESPKTQELGEASPGNIGSFAGWQIVKKYMQKNPKTTLQQLMDADDETIFANARYKP